MRRRAPRGERVSEPCGRIGGLGYAADERGEEKAYEEKA